MSDNEMIEEKSRKDFVDKDMQKGDFDKEDASMEKRKLYMRKKVCKFCVDKSIDIDYKNYDLLRRYITEGGKILPRRMTGSCAKHQRALARAIKRARYIALLPYVKQ
jgi:small subunit ribosomal protein S18